MGMYFVKNWYCKPSKKTYQGIWVPKTWNGMTNFDGCYVWTDGSDIYYSYNGTHKILNRETSTWSTNSYSSVPFNLSGADIWTYETGIYFSYYNESSDYQYNYTYKKDTNSWESWSYSAGRPPWGSYYPAKPFLGQDIWKDNDTIYFTRTTGSPRNYVLDTTQNKWVEKTWSNYSSPSAGRYVWTDGSDIYSSRYDYWKGIDDQLILNKANNTWNGITWTGFGSNSGLDGFNVWTDGTNVYLSANVQKVYNKVNREWLDKTWQGLTNFYGYNVWKDGDHIYYSSGTTQYELT